MQFAQICDRVEIDPAGVEPISLSAFPGTWFNSNLDTTGIAQIVMSESAGNLLLQIFATGPAGLIDWGKVAAHIFTSGPSSRVPAGFTACYDFDFVEIQLKGMLMKGLLVLAQFHRFKDESGRADHFGREYFAQLHGS